MKKQNKKTIGKADNFKLKDGKLTCDLKMNKGVKIRRADIGWMTIGYKITKLKGSEIKACDLVEVSIVKKKIK